MRRRTNKKKGCNCRQASLRDLYGGRFSTRVPPNGKAATFKESRGLRSARAESRACNKPPERAFPERQGLSCQSAIHPSALRLDCCFSTSLALSSSLSIIAVLNFEHRTYPTATTVCNLLYKYSLSNGILYIFWNSSFQDHKAMTA